MNANPPPAHSTVGVFGYLCLCLNVFFFSTFLAAGQQTFRALSREDYWVENLTAVWFLLAGLLLFVMALAERQVGLSRACRRQLARLKRDGERAARSLAAFLSTCEFAR